MKINRFVCTQCVYDAKFVFSLLKFFRNNIVRDAFIHSLCLHQIFVNVLVKVRRK